MIQELKSSCKNKISQGDVNVYRLGKDPELPGKDVKDPVLVYGSGGHHHKITGGKWTGIKIEGGQFILTVVKTVSLTHEQHVPAYNLTPGVYLVDRALEKGMFDDMINPVAD
jgi:hypothetical protein